MSKKGFQGSSPRSNPGIPLGTSTVQTDMLEKLCEILVAIQSPVAVESSFAQIGCIVGEDGVQTGIVMACKKPDGTFELWNFTSGQPPVGGYDGPWEVCNNLTSTNLLLEQVIEKLCDLVGDPEAPCPDCEEEKEQVVYENSDNTTELTVSVGGNGDIKFDAGSGDGSESDVVSCIESCLAAGDDVVVTWTTVDGGSGSATLLASAETNAFPNFYNQSTDASGDSGKLLTLTCG